MVAVEPVEVQVRVEDEPEVCGVNATILGGAGGRQHTWNEVLVIQINSDVARKIASLIMHALQ